MTIIDYSTSRPSIGQLKAAGITAVGRYIGWDSVPGYGSIGKNITTAEASSLITNGIAIFLAFEYAADAAAHGAPQGSADGHLAKTQLAALDAPPDMAVYFAVDYDIPDYAPALPDIVSNARAKLGPVGDYFSAINAQRNAYEVGIYGGYYAVRRCLDAGLATKAWQATAWSGGLLDARAVLYQTLAAAPISGGDIDVREHAATVPDYGQWPRPTVVPPKTIKEEDMGTLVNEAFVPFKAGAYSSLMLFRDFTNSTATSTVRVAFHSVSKGYGSPKNVVLNNSAPVTEAFPEADVDGVSLVLASGLPDVGYSFH